MIKTTKYHKIGPFFLVINFITKLDHIDIIKYCHFDNNDSFNY
jgi:hypothetical protein